MQKNLTAFSRKVFSQKSSTIDVQLDYNCTSLQHAISKNSKINTCRVLFRNQPNIRKRLPLTFFCKKSASKIFDWVLSTSLKVRINKKKLDHVALKCNSWSCEVNELKFSHWYWLNIQYSLNYLNCHAFLKWILAYISVVSLSMNSPNIYCIVSTKKLV